MPDLESTSLADGYGPGMIPHRFDTQAQAALRLAASAITAAGLVSPDDPPELVARAQSFLRVVRHVETLAVGSRLAPEDATATLLTRIGASPEAHAAECEIVDADHRRGLDLADAWIEENREDGPVAFVDVTTAAPGPAFADAGQVTSDCKGPTIQTRLAYYRTGSMLAGDQACEPPNPITEDDEIP